MLKKSYQVLDVFVTNPIPQANKEPAKDSLKNAKFFVSNIMKVVKETK